MTRADFLNRARSLHNIDSIHLPELDRAQRRHFMDEPVRYFMNCSDAHAAAIWREVEKRQAKAATVEPTDRAALEKAIANVSQHIAHGGSPVPITLDLCTVHAAARAHLATLPKGRLVWVAVEIAYDKIVGWRHFLTWEEADALADKWRSQSAGKVEVRQVEVGS